MAHIKELESIIGKYAFVKASYKLKWTLNKKKWINNYYRHFSKEKIDSDTGKEASR